VEKAGCRQHPRLAARAAGGSHAVSAVKFIVARLNDDQIRIELEGLSHNAEHGITGNGHGAEIDDLDMALRPRVLKHSLQKSGGSEVARLGVAFGGGLAHDEDAKGVRGLGIEKGILRGVASHAGIEEPGIGTCLIRDNQRAAWDRADFVEEGRVAAKPAQAQRQFDQQQQCDRQQQRKCPK